MIRRIKRIKAYLTIIIIGALSLTACTAEVIDPSIDQTQSPPEYSGEKVRMYFSFRLSLVTGAPTRAEDGFVFEDGKSESESKVSNILIFFYDKKGTCVGFFESDSFEKDGVTETGIEKLGWDTLITVPVEVYEEIKDDEIYSFFALVNYDGTIRGNYITEEKKANGEKVSKPKSLEDIYGVTHPSWTADGKGFVMTTPGHYDSAGNYLYYWTIASDSSTKKGSQIIYESASAASKNPVTVYVERLAARIEVADIKNIKGIEVLYGADVYELEFTPIAWGIEAEEKAEYISKHASSLASYTDNFPDEFANWMNYTDSRRTFWAESPLFSSNSNTYPATGSESGADFSLKYTSYKDIKLNAAEFSEKNYKGYTYTNEHTFSASELTNIDNPYAVPTSFVLKGRYTGAKWVGTDERDGTDVTHPDGSETTGNTAPTTGQDLSFENSGFYLRDIDMERTDKDAQDSNNGETTDSKRYEYRLYRENNGTVTGPKDDLYIALTKEQHIIFVKSEETYSYVDENGTSQTVITSKYVPVKESTTYGRVEAGVNKSYEFKADQIFTVVNTKRYWTGLSWISAPNTFTLQLKDTYDATTSRVPDLYYGVYNGENNKTTYIPITSANKSKANEELQKQLGYARKYYKGMAFFYSPVTHYSGDNATFGDSDSNSPYKGLFKYQTEINNGVTFYVKDEKGRYVPAHKTGEFGVVRNHIYSFTINGISSLGYGIPDESVIPLPDPVLKKEIYLFDIELKILPWNLFEYTLDI